MMEISNASACGILEVLEWAIKNAPRDLSAMAQCEYTDLKKKQDLLLGF